MLGYPPFTPTPSLLLFSRTAHGSSCYSSIHTTNQEATMSVYPTIPDLAPKRDYPTPRRPPTDFDY
ncbi:hypothetical protein DL89DRAFT_266062 [Linderina pennispora]|uniref:Uncharacterized protein n=1 Tax=Linderina pennispora TaxID=61395 RepID=A0A1Y1WG23_9FUNG|nr:uncharacterized protein DL89DRAFT_266062 [Linderina pennispora]ORX72483.1 hypothetical protein DL89DRAFT_266062 [Linderina pennispora]